MERVRWIRWRKLQVLAPDKLDRWPSVPGPEAVVVHHWAGDVVRIGELDIRPWAIADTDLIPAATAIAGIGPRWGYDDASVIYTDLAITDDDLVGHDSCE